MSASILSRTLEFISRDRHTRAVLSVLFTFTIIASGSLLALYAISPRIHVNLSVEIVSVEGSAFQVAVEPRAHFPFYFTAADRSHNRTISKLELTEDARPLGPPHGLLEGERMEVDGERIWRSCDLTDGLTEEPLPPTHWQPLPCDFVNSPV